MNTAAVEAGKFLEEGIIVLAAVIAVGFIGWLLWPVIGRFLWPLIAPFLSLMEDSDQEQRKANGSEYPDSDKS